LCFTGDLLCKIKNKLIRKPIRGDYLLFYDTGTLLLGNDLVEVFNMAGNEKLPEVETESFK